jgi:excisionase family DNA binding protein
MKDSGHTTPRPLMTVSELARYLKVSHRRIYSLLRSGDLPILRRADGIYFDRNEINRWIAERQIKWRSKTSLYRC